MGNGAVLLTLDGVGLDVPEPDARATVSRSRLRPISDDEWRELSAGLPRTKLTAEESDSVRAARELAASGHVFETRPQRLTPRGFAYPDGQRPVFVGNPLVGWAWRSAADVVRELTARLCEGAGRVGGTRIDGRLT